MLAGLSVINKMNKVYASLLVGNEKYERQVRIITTIRVGDSTKRDGYYLNYASPPNGFFRWLKSEVLSLDGLFHIHIGVGYRKRISKKFTIFNNVEGFEKLKSYNRKK